MNSAISRFTAALLAGSQENTLALAALNFDFSLYKVEAPTEYKALVPFLSDERRRLAESGSHHITARKLGAIFRGVIPPVPNLIKAYGERVCEIAESSSDLENAAKHHTIFSDKIGVDGTSIWAAATSGTEALCVQLLACLLARFWSPQEAVSIWAEVVESRKEELLAKAGNYDFPELAALQANVTREQLAEWDASARAFLRVADITKIKQQTQLRLIVDNIQVAVNNEKGTYESVLRAWVSSMKVADSLVAGVSQSVYDGAALVGLSAWHLFPDMLVYQPSYMEIKQDDPLIQHGGILTIGLEAAPETNNGVCWSLPLAKLRYYGDPVIVTKILSSRSSRITFQQLMLVVLGCLSKSWPQLADDFVSICSYYSYLWKSIAMEINEPDGVSSSWLSYLGTACDTFLAAEGEEKNSMRRLINFGLRRCESFLASHGKPIDFQSQMLNMTHPSEYLKRLAINHRVEYVREVADKYIRRPGRGEWIILYTDGRGRLLIATAFLSNGPTQHKPYHYVWDDLELLPNEKNQSASRSWKIAWKSPETRKAGAVAVFEISRITREMLKEDEFLFRYRPRQHAVIRDLQRFSSTFVVVFGSPSGAALCRIDARQNLKTEVPERIEFEEIMHSLKQQVITVRRPIPDPTCWEPLQGLGAVGSLYMPFKDPTISMDVTSLPLEGTEWYKTSVISSTPWHISFSLSRPAAFSCLTLLETGNQNLDPKSLTSVMAISITDSIYAAAQLICDPHKMPEQCEIVRTLGNIGKPGISLIIPPPAPRVRPPKPDEWNVINHYPWDGGQRDVFNDTSLHLLLTEYRVPYATELDGARDVQAFFQEAIVSIHDRGKWVGDVDILKALSDNSANLLRVSPLCPHDYLQKKRPLPTTTAKATDASEAEVVLVFRRPGNLPSSKAPIISIENWYELLDKPSSPAVVQTSGNWLSRLAVTSLCIQLGYRTIVLPELGCWKQCISDLDLVRKRFTTKGNEVVIF